MSKLREDLTIGILGAAAGLFSISVTLLIARIDAYYAYLARTQEEGYRAYESVERLTWIPISVWHIILSVVAALLVHRYLATRVRSPFMLWQLIGIASVYGWVLTLLLLVSMGCLMDGTMRSLGHLLVADDGRLSEESWLIGKYVVTVFACNVFYGSVISASSRQYVTQFDSEVAS